MIMLSLENLQKEISDNQRTSLHIRFICVALKAAYIVITDDS